jgi:hypothetical protein
MDHEGLVKKPGRTGRDSLPPALLPIWVSLGLTFVICYIEAHQTTSFYTPPLCPQVVLTQYLWWISVTLVCAASLPPLRRQMPFPNSSYAGGSDNYSVTLSTKHGPGQANLRVPSPSQSDWPTVGHVTLTQPIRVLPCMFL